MELLVHGGPIQATVGALPQETPALARTVVHCILLAATHSGVVRWPRRPSKP